MNENCDQSSVRLRQCVPGAACSTASVPSSNCLKFKSHRRVTPFEKLRCWTAWHTHGVRMAHGVRWTQVWYLTNGSCGEPLDASLHTQPMSSVQAESLLFQTPPSFSVKSLGLPGLWALGWWSGHVGTLNTHIPVIPHPWLVLISRDIFGWPSSMVNNLKQAVAVEIQRVAELEIRKTGIDFGLM